MNIRDLQTPAILVFNEKLMNNIKKYQAECDKFGKQLWPMIKTHKSTVLAEIQKNEGATGFLCGTLDECEVLCDKGMDKVMYAYPVAGRVSCVRAAQLSKKCEFYVRLDSVEAAEQLNAVAAEMNTVVNYTVILDCGLHRFGISPEEIAGYVKKIKGYENIKFKGISTHCGHVYSEADAERIPLYAKEELAAIHTAVDSLEAEGLHCELVTTGSTPTFWGTVEDEYVNVYNTLGALVKRHVRVSSALDGLDPGVYMVGNKKMIKH